jgi:hypothetical protein
MAFNYSPKVVTDGLVLYLDAANPKSYVSGSTAWGDISRGGNNGTLVNGPTYSSANGGSIVFDGVDDFVTTNLTTIGTNNTTNVLWYKWDGVNQQKALTYTGNANSTGMGLHIHNGSSGAVGNKVGVLYGGSFFNAINSGITFATLTANIYAQLVVSRDTTTTRLYQNGIFLGSTTRTPNSNTSSLNFNIGVTSTASGDISQVQIYNRALSAQEILQNYNATKTRFGL